AQQIFFCILTLTPEPHANRRGCENVDGHHNIIELMQYAVRCQCQHSGVSLQIILSRGAFSGCMCGLPGLLRHQQERPRKLLVAIQKSISVCVNNLMRSDREGYTETDRDSYSCARPAERPIRWAALSRTDSEPSNVVNVVFAAPEHREHVPARQNRHAWKP